MRMATIILLVAVIFSALIIVTGPPAEAWCPRGDACWDCAVMGGTCLDCVVTDGCGRCCEAFCEASDGTLYYAVWHWCWCDC